jgi:hypothetical protein
MVKNSPLQYNKNIPTLYKLQQSNSINIFKNSHILNSVVSEKMKLLTYSNRFKKNVQARFSSFAAWPFFFFDFGVQNARKLKHTRRSSQLYP